MPKDDTQIRINRLTKLNHDLDEKIVQLREVTRTANETLKDLKRERAEATELITTRIAYAVQEVINERVERGLVAYTKAIETATDEATAKVYERFDLMVSLLLGEESRQLRKGVLPLEELLRRYVQRNGPLDYGEYQIALLPSDLPAGLRSPDHEAQQLSQLLLFSADLLRTVKEDDDGPT
jgi:hypothetical protein